MIYLEHTDEAVLNLIKNHLNLAPSILTRQRNIRKRTYLLNLSSKKDLHSIINLIDKTDNLKGYKKIQYSDWKNDHNL